MQIVAFLSQLFPQPQRGLLLLALAALGLDWVAGIAASITTRTFSLSQLPQQLRTIFGLIGGLFIVELTTVSFFGPATNGASTATFVAAAGTLIAKSMADVAAKAAILLAGAPPATPRTVTGVDSGTPPAAWPVVAVAPGAPAAPGA